jgi:hypothetical protein
MILRYMPLNQYDANKINVKSFRWVFHHKINKKARCEINLNEFLFKRISIILTISNILMPLF